MKPRYSYFKTESATVLIPSSVVRVKQRRARDPNFRTEVICAYEQRCAVCGYNGGLVNRPLALEAAHIRWHARGGPDRVENGLALCSFHHVALDAGAIGITDDHIIKMSNNINGGPMVEEMLFQFEGRLLRRPQSPYPAPAESFVGWHWKWIFKHPPRPSQDMEQILSHVAEAEKEYNSE